jgi:hypothetical protein
MLYTTLGRFTDLLELDATVSAFERSLRFAVASRDGWKDGVTALAKGAGLDDLAGSKRLGISGSDTMPDLHCLVRRRRLLW